MQLQQQTKRMKDVENDEKEMEENDGPHLSSSPPVDYHPEGPLGNSSADASTLPTSTTRTTPSNSTSAVLLSMMHSMPFLVFGPQLAAAAAAAAALATSNHVHHQMNHPALAQQIINNRSPKSNSSSSSTDFSIDSILNDRGIRSRVLGGTSNSTQFSAWPNSIENCNYFTQNCDTPQVQPSYHHQLLCDPSPSFSWFSSQQHQHYLQLNTSPSPNHVHHHLSSPGTTTTTTTTISAEADQAKKCCSPKSTDSSSTSSSTAPKSSTPATSSKQQRKTLNRGPRIPFTSTQVAELEAKFTATQYLSSMEVSSLAKRLSLTDNRIRIWFQNRRAREKREHRAPVTESRITNGESGDQYKEENLQMMMTTKATINSATSKNKVDLDDQEEHKGDDNHQEPPFSLTLGETLD